MADALSKVYKKKFPFRIGTTSFIYPDHYAANVQKIAPFFDEIELLFFESRYPDSLPSQAVIRELQGLAAEHGVTYNIHLPSDVSLGDADTARRNHAVETIRRFMDRTRPLDPTTSTLHLVKPEDVQTGTELRHWQDALCRSMESLISKEIRGSRISIETLLYPMDQIESVIREFQLSICLDIGHMILSGQDIGKTFDTWKDRTAIVHLHGVSGETDHHSLDRLASHHMAQVLAELRHFTGTVSLEVFSLINLYRSITFLEEAWDKYCN